MKIKNQERQNKQEQHENEHKEKKSNNNFEASNYKKFTNYLRTYTTLENYPAIKGHDFEKFSKLCKNSDFQEFLESFGLIGIQAANLGKGIEIVRMMQNDKPKIFLSFTSSIISSGLRDIITFLVKHKHVDVLCTSAGGVEEDVIKAIKPFVIGDFDVSGRSLFESSIGRIGNIFAPLERYAYFELFMKNFFEGILSLQKKQKNPLTPSQFISELGKYIDSAEMNIDKESSYIYWAYKNNIPVFCPAITDGAIGDLLYFQKQSGNNIQIDVVPDHEKIVKYCLDNEKTAAIALGGGSAKHYVLNANIFKDGLDYAVYVTTAQEFDASDSGGNPEEAKTWAKLKVDAPNVKIKAEASIVFPLLVAATFGKG
ncbi:MAG: deoxyhypusine synthase [Candidatus Woesearchaeota archaeon]